MTKICTVIGGKNKMCVMHTKDAKGGTWNMYTHRQQIGKHINMYAENWKHDHIY